MYLSAAELLYRYVFTRNRFYYLRTGDEHIRVLLGHHDEVRKSGAVNGTTSAGAEDNGNLRNNARSKDITLEDLCVTCQCASTFLNTCATRVVQTDDRCT